MAHQRAPGGYGVPQYGNSNNVRQYSNGQDQGEEFQGYNVRPPGYPIPNQGQFYGGNIHQQQRQQQPMQQQQQMQQQLQQQMQQRPPMQTIRQPQMQQRQGQPGAQVYGANEDLFAYYPEAPHLVVSPPHTQDHQEKTRENEIQSFDEQNYFVDRGLGEQQEGRNYMFNNMGQFDSQRLPSSSRRLFEENNGQLPSFSNEIFGDNFFRNQDSAQGSYFGFSSSQDSSSYPSPFGVPRDQSLPEFNFQLGGLGGGQPSYFQPPPSQPRESSNWSGEPFRQQNSSIQQRLPSSSSSVSKVNGMMTMEELEGRMMQMGTPSQGIFGSQHNDMQQNKDVSRLVSFGIALRREEESEESRPLPPQQMPSEPVMSQLQRNIQPQQVSLNKTGTAQEPNSPPEAGVGESGDILDKDRAEKKAARTARFLWQPAGTMTVSPARTGPNQYIQVNWTIPAQLVLSSSFQKEGDNAEVFDWVGLFRARTRVDATDGFILSRDVNGRSQLDQRTGLIHGSMRLRTPRGVGQYNFRYFKGISNSLIDSANKKDFTLPLARSNTVRVEVQGADMFEALDFVQRNLSERRKLQTATMQFATLLRQLRTLRAPLQDPSAGNGANRNYQQGPGNRQGGGRRQPQSSWTEVEQESSLFRELWNTVGNCVSYVQRRCSDLTTVIEQEERVLEERKFALRAFDGLIEKVGGKDGKLGDDEEDEISVPHGSLSEEEMNRFKDAKERLISAERSYRQNVRDRATLSSSLRAVLNSFLTSTAIENLLKVPERNRVEEILNLFCPVDEIFLPSLSALEDHYREDFEMQFLSSPKELRFCPNFADRYFVQRMGNMQAELSSLLPTLIPDASMEQTRLRFIEELQVIVDKAGLKWGCVGKLVPFGSSVNNFGSAGSDLDLCLVLIPRGARWPDAIHEESPTEEDGAPGAEKAVTDLAEVVSEHGFTEVDDSRKSARIPILQFHHAPLQLECDICIDNRLAIRNTLLLRTYSVIDPRVRQMAYVIKRWAKRRNINNPAQRTLSSYGYILILIHFLQQLPVPLLPPLQSLPPNWDGQTIIEDDPSLPVVLVQSNDGKQHNTYFYGDSQSRHFLSPSAQQGALQKLQMYASRNQQRLSELLVGFFWSLAFGFDWRRFVIAIRDFNMVTKETKASEDSWKLHQRIAIEDPFETGYDVAHVVRDKEFRLMRREFVRAYAILSGSATTGEGNDTTILIEALCQERVDEQHRSSISQ